MGRIVQALSAGTNMVLLKRHFSALSKFCQIKEVALVLMLCKALIGSGRTEKASVQ